MKFLKIVSLILALSVTIMSAPIFRHKVQALDEKELKAPSAVLMDAATGKVLFEKDSHSVRPCASITKVMTLILVMEAIESGRLSYDEMITASAHAASMGGSDIWLEPGETMSVDDMIKATIVASANDAAVALAEAVCGTEEEFVNKMNEKAKSLGMKETVFKNCNGLDEDGHVTSAYDVAVMSRELLKHKKILDYSGIWMDELRGGKTQLVNTNKLLKTYKGITGLKTGTTSQAGSCISATAQRDGLHLIAVVLGCSGGKERFSDAAKLLDCGFAGYMMYVPGIPDEASVTLPVISGMTDSVKTTVSKPEPVLLKKDSSVKVEPKVYLPSEVEAPISKGDVLGKLTFECAGNTIAEYPIISDEDVKEINFADVSSLFFSGLSN